MGTAFALPALAVLAVAAWRDLGSRMIPDALPAVLLLTGLVVRLRGGGIAGAGASLLLATLLFSALAALHARGWLGGGDVKLAAGLTVGLPPAAVPLFLVATGIAGGVLAALHLALRALPRRPRHPPRPAGLLRRVWRAERWRITRRAPLPYGIAIACGGAWALLTAAGG